MLRSLSLCIAMYLLGQVPSPSQARLQIQARYDSWSKAYMANDVDTLLSILAPDYSLRTSEGTEIKRNEYEATLKLRKAAKLDGKKYRTRILKLELISSGADVVSRETMSFMQPNPKTGKSETVVHEHDYRDDWILRDGKWLLRRTVTLKERTSVKGVILRFDRAPAGYRRISFGGAKVNLWRASPDARMPRSQPKRIMV